MHVVHDDDDLHTILPSKLAENEHTYCWRWLLTAGRVYLLRWDPMERVHVVFREPDGNIITSLRR